MLVTDACIQAIGEDEFELIADLAGDYVLPREYILVHGGDTGKMDAAMAQLLQTLGTAEYENAKLAYAAARHEALQKTGHGKSFYDAFVVQHIAPWSNRDDGSMRLPGLDSSNCSFNWKTFACFCNAASFVYKKSVEGGADLLTPYLEATAATDGYAIAEGCSARVLSDPVYDMLATYTPNASGSAPGPLPPGPPEPPAPPGPPIDPVKVDEDHEGPPWWVWAGLVVGGTVLLWPIVRK